MSAFSLSFCRRILYWIMQFFSHSERSSFVFVHMGKVCHCHWGNYVLHVQKNFEGKTERLMLNIESKHHNWWEKHLWNSKIFINPSILNFLFCFISLKTDMEMFSRITLDTADRKYLFTLLKREKNNITRLVVDYYDQMGFRVGIQQLRKPSNQSPAWIPIYRLSKLKLNLSLTI